MKKVMNNWIVIGSIGLICGASSFGAMTGKVIDEKGNPIYSANLSLFKGTQIKGTATTDSSGNFSLVEGVMPVSKNSIIHSSFHVQGNTLSMDLKQQSFVKITLADAQGRHVRLVEGLLPAGNASWKIEQKNQIQWLIVEVNGKQDIQAFQNIGGWTESKLAMNGRSARTFAVGDSIKLTKKGYFTQKMIVANVNQDYGVITLKKPAEWDSVSHDNAAGIDASLLFSDNKVNHVDIVIAEADWQALMDDMTIRFGLLRPRQTDSRLYISPLAKGTPVSENPIYVPAQVKFNGQTWNHVGFRFKGNATLSGSWANNPLHLPFKLDFDEYENEYPEINNQRFYGVKQFSIYNHKSDNSFIREKLLGDLYRDAGVAVPRRGYYEVNIDFGKGSQNFGLFTFVESPYGQTMKDLFQYTGTQEGNIYKPEGPMDTTLRKAAQLRLGAPLNQITFEKQNNYDKNASPVGDWSDVQDLINIVNSNERTTNATAWRTKLEARLNVPGFLKWLAVNTVYGSFDAYGKAPHNYFLYGNPANNGQLNWVAYDLNFSLSTFPSQYSQLDQSDITAEYPLIRNLIDDPVYNAQYWNALKDYNNLFSVTQVNQKVDQLWNLILPALSREVNNFCNWPCYLDSKTFYEDDKNAIKTTILQRKSDLQNAINGHTW